MKAQRYTKETISELGLATRQLAEFTVGDTISVSQRIKEGEKERIQLFEGDVIAIHNNGASSTFTVRKIGAQGVAVERIFPFHSPRIEKVAVVKRGLVRRAKLYYVRHRLGKSARLREKLTSREQSAQKAESTAQQEI